MGGWVYIRECRDGSYYDGYTARRRPVDLIWSSYFESLVDAFFLERKLKRWSRAKKEAFMAGNITRLKGLARRRAPFETHR